MNRFDFEHRTAIVTGAARGIGYAASLICWLASEENSFAAGAVFDNSGGRAVY
jgi:3-oxoacyl-[acyl-carrier protein] reductase